VSGEAVGAASSDARAGRGLVGALAGLALRLFGWTPVGTAPSVPKYVFIAAPHTSNWDFPLMLICGLYFGVRMRFMGKAELFRWPLGTVMRRLGGIPIERSRRGDVVAATAAAFRSAERLAIGIPPDGSRRYCEYWKSGFYHIARTANVPIVPSYLDWGTRRGGFGPPLLPTGDVRADMEILRTFYAGMVGRYPEKTSRVRLREEDATPGGDS
jgi:1-acyl-sn-glycerol-3-phosphate acyltransferase